MTQEQEKAKELVDKFKLSYNEKLSFSNVNHFNNAKQCAIICVNEIIISEPRTPSNVDWDDCGGTHKYYYEAQREEANLFWNKVLTEIEKL